MLLKTFFGKKGNANDPIVSTPGSSTNGLSLPSTSTTPTPYEPSAPACPVSDPQANSQPPLDASQDSMSSASTSTIAINIESPPPASIETNISLSQCQREPYPQPSSPKLSLSPSSTTTLATTTSTSSNPTSTAKRKLTADTLSRTPSKRQKQQQQKMPKQLSGQTKLSTFFAKPPPAPSPSSSPRKSKSKSAQISDPEPDTEALAQPTVVANIDQDIEPIDGDADHYLALLDEAQAQEPSSDFSSSPNDNGNGNSTSKRVWSTLLAPTTTPKCTAHGEPAKELTVTKQGPNRGKRFFICAR